ncbi:MAG: helix-turn-helix transcriptional regulator [Firmicutes bacterium]|nr:helix-turn-helix transcriptional regulator [Bacillota bacterium]
MTLNEAIIKRIYEICTEKNITLNKLSTICGITQSTLNNIVSKKSLKPTVSTIKKICDGMEIDLCDFFDTDYFKTLDQEIK